MKQTEIFDQAASEFGRPFTREEILVKLQEEDRQWEKDTYLNNCIRDRAKKGMLTKVEEDSYLWTGEPTNMANREASITVSRSRRQTNLPEGLTRNEGLVELTKENADAVGEAIRNNPRYPEKARKLFKDLKGPVPLFTPGDEISCEDIYDRFTEEEMLTIVRQIKIDNKIQHCKSGQLSIIRDFIMDPANHFFYRNLRGDLTLVEDLNTYVGIHGDRAEPSLSSKICKFLNSYLYGEDCYFIYDSVVKKSLDRYRRSYGLPTMPKNYYTDYFNALEDLRVNACPSLSRNEVDHIIWYTNK